MKIDVTAAQLDLLLRLTGAGGDPAHAPKVRRKAVEGVLPQRLLERCDVLTDLGRTPALVAIADGVCSGCHVRLPTMLTSQARSGVTVHGCPRCQRLLYVPAPPAAAPPATAAERGKKSAEKKPARQRAASPGTATMREHSRPRA